MLHWIAKLAYIKIGGLTWWKSLGAVAAGLLTAWGMGFRYGGASNAWIAVLVVSVASICLIWWSHVQMSGDKPKKRRDD